MAERIKFTAARVSSLTIETREYAVWDEGTPGFGVRVYPTGKRRFVYRYRAGASRSAPARMVTIGDVRKIGLEDARRTARDLAGQVARGRDPSAEKRKSEVDRVRKRRLNDVREEFLAKHADARLRPATAREYRRVLTREFNLIAEKPFDEVGRADIAAVLQTIADRGRVRQANVARAVARKLFSWAKAQGLCDTNPVSDTAPAGRDTRRERVLSAEELGLIYRAALEMDDTFGAIVRFLMLTGQRRTEVLELTVDELDLEQKIWRLPATRTKNRRAHDVPLSDSAIAILSARPSRKLLFSTTAGTPFGAVSKAKKRLDEKVLAFRKAANPKSGPLPHWTLHDLRRSFVTHAHDHLGISIPVIERAINHISGTFGGVVGVYNRAPLLKERRAAFYAWEAFVLDAAGLSRTGTPAGRAA
jgi:integrase